MKTKFVLLIVSIILSLFIAELALQAAHGNHFFIRTPHSHYLLKPESQYLPGIEGEARFIVNSLGLRGDELQNQEIRILSIGGSTSEGAYLDQAETWQYLLQNMLEQKTGKRVWIGNAGMPRRASPNHVLQLEKLLNQISDIDLVIVLMGFNDMGLSSKKSYNPRGFDDPVFIEECLRDSFEVTPLRPRRIRDLELYKRLFEFFDLITKSGTYKLEGYARNGAWHEQKRLQRQRSAKITLSKEMETRFFIGLEDYKKNIERMINLSRKHHTKILFLTQPSLYKVNMPEEEEKLLMFGALPDQDPERPNVYVLASEIKRLLDLYNQSLLETAGKNGAWGFDLDKVISPASDSFYDDLHFNEAGAKRVAESVSQNICNARLLSCQ